ncbi:MAG: DNA polymerase III subunit delta, partial [Cyclobacteriaceae bacterium]|nr:DNA polymerase III subunit delta [Cyclobacteriaceae bacterium]
MSPLQVLEELKKGNYQPVYFLQGDEPYFIDLIADYIEEHALQEAEKGFNQMIMYGKDCSVSTVLSNARRFPMMAPRQVVLVKEAQEITDFGRQDAQKMLQDYLEQPLSSTILVFCYKYKTLDGRKALSKTIAKKALLVDCKKLYDNQIPTWVMNHVDSKGFKIDPPTAQLLADYIGNNLERMNSEINKVLINLQPGNTVNTDLIQRYVGISKEYNVFELQKALSFKDNLKAQRIVQYFGANPKLNPVIPVIAVLFTYYSK